MEYWSNSGAPKLCRNFEKGKLHGEYKSWMPTHNDIDKEPGYLHTSDVYDMGKLVEFKKREYIDLSVDSEDEESEDYDVLDHHHNRKVVIKRVKM